MGAAVGIRKRSSVSCLPPRPRAEWYARIRARRCAGRRPRLHHASHANAQADLPHPSRGDGQRHLTRIAMVRPLGRWRQRTKLRRLGGVAAGDMRTQSRPTATPFMAGTVAALRTDQPSVPASSPSPSLSLCVGFLSRVADVSVWILAVEHGRHVGRLAPCFPAIGNKYSFITKNRGIGEQHTHRLQSILSCLPALGL